MCMTEMADAAYCGDDMLVTDQHARAATSYLKTAAAGARSVPARSTTCTFNWPRFASPVAGFYSADGA